VALLAYRAARLSFPHSSVLEHQDVVIPESVRSLGATLWTDVDRGRDAAAALTGPADFSAMRTDTGDV
jgi:hypothetical protein